MAGFGFNTDVRVGEQIYHVQTEPCQRPAAAIETSVFQAGLVQYVRRMECEPEGDGALDARVREQHGAVIRELRAGTLRGLGPALELDWTNAAAADPEAAELQLEMAVRCGQQPAAGCELRATLAGEGGEAMASAAAATDQAGRAVLALPLPAAPRPALRLMLEAERGLSVGRRQFRLA